MVELQRRRFSVLEYDRMRRVGILRPSDRVELLLGDVVQKVTIGNRHRGAVNRLVRLLTCLQDRAYLQVQMPIVVADDSEPEPDVSLIRINEAAVGKRHVVPPDVIAVIEVSDSSREVDLRLKGPMYAHAGIAEYWMVDLVDEVIRVSQDPHPGRYGITAVARRGDRIGFAAFPDETFSVEEILGATAGA